MKYKAVVLHQVGPGMFFGVNEGSEFFHAHDFEIEADAPMQAADLIFEITNLDPGEINERKALLYGSQMREYRKRMNRSMSVGDVLVLREADGEQGVVAVLACATVGWEPMNVMPGFEFSSNTTPESRSYRAHQELMEAQ